MAQTLTGTGELLYASFPIDKVETDADGDLIVFGKASDGDLDSDQQVVAPAWMSQAAQTWKESGANLRVQHNAQRDPAGVGLEVETDASGATWVKGLVVEPIAKKLVAKGALRAYSVGIARPTIERDPTGKARGGIITGGELVEISLVDRPANKRCGIQLVKAADDGTPEYVGKVFGSDDEIAKALGSDVTKSQSADMTAFALPDDDLSVTFTPADMARLMQTKIVEKHYSGLADAAKRDIGAADRRRLADEGKALPNLSYPVETASDLENAAHLARTGHGDTDAARDLIARRADELGVANPLDSDAKKAASSEPEETVEKADAPEVQDEAVPDVAKDKPVKKATKKPKGKKKLPPWLNKPDDSGDDGGACKQDHIHTEKCHTDPATASGVTGHEMNPAPVGELLESPPVASTKGSPTPQSASGASAAAAMTPVPAHREPDGAIVEPFEKDAQLPATGQGEKPTAMEAGMMKSSPDVAALLRFKSIGINPDLGRLHDLTCPAYHPDEVQRFHPFADIAGLVDTALWQRKALEAACGPVEHALKMHEMHQAALALKAADPAELNQWRLEAHKAFRDANPGPGTYPTPGAVSPQKYNRPLITDGRAATSTGHDGPNTSPQVATSAPDAHSFDRPPLDSAHASPSPSFMKGGFTYPPQQGVPTHLTYARQVEEQQHEALSQMHAHLGSMYPAVCPMDLNGPAPETRHPVPSAVGVGKSGPALEKELAERIHNGEISIDDARTALGLAPFGAPETSAPVAAAFKAPADDPGEFADEEIYKGFKKARKKMGKKVLSGKMTVDEARSRLGRQFAQKAADPELPASPEDAEKTATAALIKSAVAEALASTAVQGEVVTLEAANFGTDPEVIKAAVAEATSELKELLVKQQETFTEKLADQQRVIDAIADQPDPSTAAFSGLAFNPVRTKAAGPAGVLSQAAIAERSQQMMIRHLSDTVNSASDPYEREAAYATLTRLRGGDA